jgi:hypothetical protein
MTIKVQHYQEEVSIPVRVTLEGGSVIKGGREIIKAKLWATMTPEQQMRHKMEQRFFKRNS